MITRTLGSGLEVSAIGLGCMGLSHGYDPPVGRAARRGRQEAAGEHGLSSLLASIDEIRGMPSR